jgi:hypothetical protein
MRAKPSSKADHNEDLLGPLGSTAVNGGDLAVEHWKNRRKQAEARSFLDWAERAAPPKEDAAPKPKPGSCDDIFGKVNQAETPAPLTLQERQDRMDEEVRQEEQRQRDIDAVCSELELTNPDSEE